MLVLNILVSGIQQSTVKICWEFIAMTEKSHGGEKSIFRGKRMSMRRLYQMQTPRRECYLYTSQRSKDTCFSGMGMDRSL